MNIAIGNKTFGRNSRIGFGIIAGGLSLAAVLIGVDAWPAADSRSPQAVTEAPAAAAVRPVDLSSRAATPVHYFLVNSQDQIDALQQAEFEASANNGGTQTDFVAHVIDLRTPDGEALYRALQEDLYVAMTQPSGFDASLVQVHDLTAAASAGPATAAVSPASSLAPAEPSTLFVVGSEAEKQALLYEADVAAAVEGSDSGLPNVLVVGSPEQENQYRTIVEEQMLLSEPGLKIIDLR